MNAIINAKADKQLPLCASVEILTHKINSISFGLNLWTVQVTSAFLNPCRYSGTGRATWSLNSGIWSTTCWYQSCCCVYVPTSTSTTSGKGGNDDMGGRTRELGGPWRTWRTRWRTDELVEITWKFSDQNRWRFYGSSGMTARTVGAALTLTRSQRTAGVGVDSTATFSTRKQWFDVDHAMLKVKSASES